MYDSDYQAWKGWSRDAFGALSKIEKAYFHAEISDLTVPKAGTVKVLELGFGNGSFLQFARNIGWEVVGTELEPELLDRASSLGFEVLHADQMGKLVANTFDMVFAFDVLEHIPRENLAGFLLEVKRVLKRGGEFMARFPNGDTSIGLPHQNGDLTHVTSIGKGICAQLSTATDFPLVKVSGTASPLKSGSIIYTLHRLFSNPYKWIANSWKNLIYFPVSPVNFTSPNLIAVFTKK